MQYESGLGLPWAAAAVYWTLFGAAHEAECVGVHADIMPTLSRKHSQAPVPTYLTPMLHCHKGNSKKKQTGYAKLPVGEEE